MSSTHYSFGGVSYPLIGEEKVNGVKLYPHQRISIHKMEETEKQMSILSPDGLSFVKTRTAVFADHPGYGKTFSLCALIKRDKMKFDPMMFVECGSINKYYRFDRVFPDDHPKIKTTLLVLPLGIVKQWKDALAMFDLTHVTINKKNLVDSDVSKYDVAIVTSTMYKHFYEATLRKDLVYRRMIFDEPDSTKIVKFRELNFLFRWFVTGTPIRLLGMRRNAENQISNWIINYELHSHLGNYIIQNEINLIEDSIRLPPINNITHRVVYSRMQNLAMRHVDYNVREAIMNGNMDDAARLMGWDGKGDITSCIIDKYRARIEVLEHEKQGIELRINRHGERAYFTDRISELNTRIRSLEDCIKEVDEEKKNILEADCSICLDKCQIPVMTKCCNTVSCRDCLMEWLNASSHKNCHMCRKQISPDMVVRLTDQKEGDVEDRKDGDDDEESAEEKKKEDEPMSKKATIEKLLVDGGSDKRWIIFANSRWSFEELGSSILNQFKYEELKGSTGAINNVLKRFKSGDTPIILVNNDHNCAGINILDATDVIIHDSSSSDQELQCIKRAHRMGRTTPLTVHKFERVF